MIFVVFVSFCVRGVFCGKWEYSPAKMWKNANKELAGVLCGPRRAKKLGIRYASPRFGWHFANGRLAVYLSAGADPTERVPQKILHSGPGAPKGA